MANFLFLLVILLSVGTSLQNTADNEVEEDANPISDVVNSILKEQNAQNMGAMVQNFLQNDGANVIGNILGGLGKQNAGQLLGTLGSLMGSQKNNKGGSNSPNIFETIGNLVGSVQSDKNGEEFNSGALLQGIGSLLLANQQGQGGGVDSSMIGLMADLLSQQIQTPEKSDKKIASAKRSDKSKKRKDDFDSSNLIGMVASLLGMQGKQGSQQGSFMNMLPMILQTINSFSGPEAKQREASHSDHSSQLPPFLEKIHLYFDHFIHSDMGKVVISNLNAEKAFSVFMDDNQQFDYKKFGELMENRSFRRQWIRLITDRIISFLQHASKPTVYKEYLVNGQLFINSYLIGRGFPKETLLDSKRPVDTISALADYVAKIYFDVQISSREYVEPAVEYAEELLKLSEKQDLIGDETREMGNKIADTLNFEFIEPLARVNRAYRYAKAVPKCTRYVLCLVNKRDDDNEPETIPRLKKVLYKASSLVAGWYLSSYTNMPFWTLYSDVSQSPNCKNLYYEECNGFHVEELKATTEYVHNEL